MAQSDDGGDSSAVQGQLRNVQQVPTTFRAFAAIRWVRRYLGPSVVWW